ncbi:Dolichyl-phosphate-mannose-protein mannosyltransferase-domain-containing protein [Cladochytrium replicatum]|nr:Dolichyl-phosphate-mannose-protein mannosyltransferase-domain-containing protein [Cladochytrium replicatum]
MSTLAQDGLRKRVRETDLAAEEEPLIEAGIASDEKEVKIEAKRQLDAERRWEFVIQIIIPAVLTITSIWTHCYKIGWSDIVVWDEAHFGKFASHYINRDFYFDVHPPLGKILLGMSGIIAQYNGSFAFESGAKYPTELNYPVMRIFCALFGAFTVPVAYYTALGMRLSSAAAVLIAVMTLTDIAFLAISRFILLDSMLLFFTTTSALCLVKFREYQKLDPFSFEWWFWLAFSGLSLGTVLSVKWVGLFAIALVGLHTVEDLWEMLGDLKMPPRTYINHWLARIVFLILVPASVYIFSFWLHFEILNRSGPGDAQMSSLFQANLIGNDFHENPLQVAYGSKVTLKNNGRGGGLLHSHVQRFPTGSEQQQVTCYHHKDANNEWTITKPWNSPEPERPDEIEFLKNGDVIRLVHIQTGRNLHSHVVKAPITSSENEVSCYGNATIGDQNDHWKVEIYEDVAAKDIDIVRSLTTRFRLRHVMTGCLLRSHAVNLPQWGFKQAEVICQKRGDNSSINNIWNIEQHWNDKLPPGGKGLYKRRFWNDFIDLNVAMWSSNNALTPDPDKEPDNLVSQPWQWPLLLVGLRMCGWGDDAVKFFLLGHPLIWWGSAVSLVVFLGLMLFYGVRSQRQCKDWTDDEWDDFWFAGKVGFGGWFLHYLPFWIMGRVTYLHHYFPALYFGILCLGFILDHATKRFSSRVQAILLSLATVAMIAVYLYFADFAFGFTGPARNYAARQWLKTWRFYD